MAASASTSINKSPDKQLEYETIDNVIKNCKKDKSIDKINVYGVLTFIYAKPTQNFKSFKSEFHHFNIKFECCITKKNS